MILEYLQTHPQAEILSGLLVLWALVCAAILVAMTIARSRTKDRVGITFEWEDDQ